LAIIASNLSAWRQYYNGGAGGVIFGAPAASIAFTFSGGIGAYGANGYWRGLPSTTNGETVTATVQGDAVYIIYDRFKTVTGGTFSVSIDGSVVVASVSCNGSSLACEGSDQGTADNSTFGYPTLLRVGTTPGRHTVVVTVTSTTNASNKVQIEGIAGSEDMMGPTAVVAATARMNAAGYSGSAAAYASAAIGDAAVAAFNQVSKAACDMLYSDGLRVHFAATSVYDPAAISSQVQGDNIHPTATGAAVLATAFTNALDIRTIRQRRAYGQALYSPPVGASPYTFTNNGQNDVTAIVTAGTVSAVDYSRDGSTFFTVAAATGAQVTLSPSDSVKLTYTVAPTLTIVPR
jgi:hypothetical protein